MQRTVGLNRKVFEVTAEFVQVEFAGYVITVSHGHLVIITNVFVHFPYGILVRKSIGDTFHQACTVVSLV